MLAGYPDFCEVNAEMWDGIWGKITNSEKTQVGHLGGLKPLSQGQAKANESLRSSLQASTLDAILFQLRRVQQCGMGMRMGKDQGLPGRDKYGRMDDQSPSARDERAQRPNLQPDTCIFISLSSGDGCRSVV